MEATITDLINASAYGQNGVPHELWTHLRKESPVYWYAQRGHTPFWAITKQRTSWRYQASPTSSPTKQAESLSLTKHKYNHLSKVDREAL